MSAYPYPRYPDVRPLDDTDRNILADLAHEGETFCDECEEWVYDDDSHPHTRCADCGQYGETTGHMDCQYPQDRDEPCAWEPDTGAEARGDK